MKLPFGKVKCNIDATFLDGKVGIGICLRDHDVHFVRAKTLYVAAQLTVKEGEAFGLLLKWVGELGLNNIIFNLDAKSVVDSFNKTTHDLSYFGFIIKDCKSCLLSLCSNSLVEFFRRQVNMIAHIS
jgi:hypothetical protein